MATLASIMNRLVSESTAQVELRMREHFIESLKGLKTLGLSPSSRVLSISTGDGIWDYLTLKTLGNEINLVATDVVSNPVKKDDQILLQKLGKWSFVQVAADGALPFANDSFDFIYHQDVIEHTQKPYGFVKEQFRVLKPGGTLLCGTPNLFRPANVLKLLMGRLRFPVKIGANEEIGDYIHECEFHERHLELLLRESGFSQVRVDSDFFGLHFLNLQFSAFPASAWGRLMSHYIVSLSQK